MAWPERYQCPDCGEMVSRPNGARAWGCCCHLGQKCRCRMLDAIACYRCGKAEGFPRHETEPMTEEVLHKSIVLHSEQTASDRGYSIKELNEKRRVYCDRCLHEQFFLQYSDTDIVCLLCGATGPRGVALTHQTGLGV